MKYKEGDKVRVVKFPNIDYIGMTATVSSVYSNHKYDYVIKWDSPKVREGKDCSMYESEIELIDSQLMFAFMYE